MRVGCTFLLLLVACDKPKPAPSGAATSSTATAHPTPAPTATASPRVSAASSSSSSSTSVPAPVASSRGVDAGARLCRLTFGPVLLPFVGAPTAAIDEGDVAVVFNDRGTPRVTRTPWNVAPSPPPPPAPSAVDAVGTNSPACALAGSRAFCASVDHVYSASIRGAAPQRTTVTTHRARGPVAAAVLGERTLVTWLEERTTSEGPRAVAMARVDTGEPFAVTDDGSGATWIDAEPRPHDTPPRITLVSIDARTSMVPVHARDVRFGADGKVELSGDVVVAVGGAPSSGVRVQVGSAARQAPLVLFADAKNVRDFGLSLIRLDAPYKEETPRVWRVYPNGLDPAPVAATHAARAAYVAFARPENPSGKPVVVELARIEERSVLTTLALSTSSDAPTDLSLVVDPRAALWLVTASVHKATLERWECPQTLDAGH